MGRAGGGCGAREGSEQEACHRTAAATSAQGQVTKAGLGLAKATSQGLSPCPQPPHEAPLFLSGRAGLVCLGPRVC